MMSKMNVIESLNLNRNITAVLSTVTYQFSFIVSHGNLKVNQITGASKNNKNKEIKSCLKWISSKA